MVKKNYLRYKNKIMNPKDEYKQIKGFFLILFSITTFFLGVVLVFTFRDYNSFKEQTRTTIEQYENRLEKYDLKMNNFLTLAQKTVDATGEKSQNEINQFTATVKNLARIEAVNRINELLEFTNLKTMVDTAVQKVASNRLNEMTEQKIKIAETKMTELLESSLSLLYYMQNVADGDIESLIYLQNIAKMNTSRGHMAQRIIEIKYNDYRFAYKNRYGQDTTKILDNLGIKKETRSNEISTIDEVIKIMKDKNQLFFMALGALYLEILGHETINFFDFEEIEKLENWKKSSQ